MELECINRVELRGIVGTSRVTEVGDRNLINFSLATNYAYKDKDGYPVIESTWHACKAWAEREDDLTMYGNGTSLHIEGRKDTQHPLHRRKRLREDHAGGSGVKG